MDPMGYEIFIHPDLQSAAKKSPGRPQRSSDHEAFCWLLKKPQNPQKSQSRTNKNI